MISGEKAMNRRRTIQVSTLSRVEGEGALELDIQDDRIQKLLLRIYEPPRFFEKFLEQRSYDEIPDIVARICGICPVAYQMSALHAVEQIFGVGMSPWVREMRRLFYCGEWLQSHSLHIYFLALPDFLGFQSAIEMAKLYPDEVNRGMRLQKLGNEIIKFLGGRSVHPVGACVGGFSTAPSLDQAKTLLAECQARLPDMLESIHFLKQLHLPKQFDQDITCVSLRHPTEYPLNEGRLVSNRGLDIPIEAFDQHFSEMQVPYSTALHCALEGKTYLTGPLSRLNLNHDVLPEAVLQLIDEIGLRLPTYNMFDSLFARAIEMYFAIYEAIRILSAYETPSIVRPDVVPVRAGVGFGCTEAPRGFCWHRYELDEKGMVTSARIVPPTSQNQGRIEEDLRFSLERFGLNHSDDDLRRFAETLIRNYDPCISCSVHFLNCCVRRS